MFNFLSQIANDFIQVNKIKITFERNCHIIKFICVKNKKLELGFKILKRKINQLAIN